MKTSHRIAIATTVLAVTALAFVIIRRRDAAEPATPVSGARLAPAGTSATAPVPSRLVTLEVGGMVCAACVNKVQTQIAKVPGCRESRSASPIRRRGSSAPATSPTRR